MAIKVAIYRKMSKEQKMAIQNALIELTTLAVSQSGYLSGESLVNLNDPEEHLTLCSWKSQEDWECFSNLQKAKELHGQIDLILVRPTEHRFYQ